MQVNINEDKENSGDGSKIRKILEAQSEKPEKAEKGVGNSRETEPKIMKDTAEHAATAQKCCATDGEGKTEGSSSELQIHKIKETEDSDGTVDINITEDGRSDICKTDNNVSKDEFDSDLFIEKGESNGEKRVTFQLDSDQMEITKSSTGVILDSSQETESVMSGDPIWDSSQDTVQSNVTQITTEDTVTFTEETDEDYPPLRQNIHRPWYIKKSDDLSDSEPKWADLEAGDKLQR